MIIPKKPPDIYKTYKNSYRNIIKDIDISLKINDAIYRTNQIITRTYRFLRLYLISKNTINFDFNDKQNTQLLDNLIRDTFVAICRKGQGKRRTINPVIQEFYTNEYLPLQTKTYLLDKVNLNQILNYETEKMITCYKNNIVANYFTYLFRFVNTVFDIKENQEYNSITNEEDKKIFKKQYFTELKKVKQDLIKNTLTSLPEYHNWITNIRTHIIPNLEEESIHLDIKINPLKYISGLKYMIGYLEERDKKLFQIFPLRNNICLKHIDIDTKTLVELSDLKNKKQYLDAIKENKNFLWNNFLKMKYMKKRGNYIFNDRIQTDGVSVSLSYIDNLHYGKKNVKQKKFKGIEFPYIDEVNYEELQKDYKENNYVFIDPGKIQLLYMKDKNNKYLRYTNSQRLKETERLKIQSQLEKIKNKYNIQEIESQLSTFNSKTLNYELFKEFIKKKEELDEILLGFYSQKFLRKFNRRRYINKQRHEQKIINNIKETFGENPRLVIGNWNIQKQMRNFISTPCLGLKRLLAKNFKVLTIDEFRTSCVSHLDNTRVDNLKINGKKIHPVLMLTQKNNRMGCISRDKNAVLNFDRIFQQYLIDQSRPLVFRRDYQLPPQ